MVNQLLIGLTSEIRSTFYDVFGMVMYIVILAALVLACRKYGVTRGPRIRLFVAFFAAFFAGNGICSVLSNLTNGIIPGINLGVAFLVFLLVLSLLLRLLKAPVRQLQDIAVPVFILGRGVGIIGCLFTGCCHGFPMEWGIYSNVAQTTVVPTVLIDMVASYIIVAYLLLTEKKQSASGMTAAKGMLLFGILRYVIDVLRDNEKLISMMTVEGICGILYALAGLILLYALSEKRVKATKSLEFSV